MNLSKLLFVLVLTSLMTFASCTKEAVDPRVGTWQSEVGTSSLGNVYIEVTYSASNTVKIDVKSSPSDLLVGSTTSSWIKEINSTTDLYEITFATSLGQSTTVNETFHKVSADVDGNTMEFASYESDSTTAGAEASTVIILEGTLEKQ